VQLYITCRFGSTRWELVNPGKSDDGSVLNLPFGTVVYVQELEQSHKLLSPRNRIGIIIAREEVYVVFDPKCTKMLQMVRPDIEVDGTGGELQD
jgi:hypothetical protein